MAGRARTSGTHQVQGVAPGACVRTCVRELAVVTERVEYTKVFAAFLEEPFFFESLLK